MVSCLLLQASHKQDLILSFPEHGLHLIFNGINQRLRLIEVFDLSRTQVKIICSANLELNACSCIYTLHHEPDKA